MIVIKTNFNNIKKLMEINKDFINVPKKMKIVDIKYKFISLKKNGSIKAIFYETNHQMYYLKLGE